MATNTKRFFSNDLVAHTTDYGLLKLGLVVIGNTMTSFGTFDRDKYHIIVRWYPDGQQQTMCEQQIVLLDRSFVAGNKVFKTDLDSKRQFGYVDSVEKQAAIKIFNTNKILEDVDSSNLTNIRKFVDNSIVLYDSIWVGKVLHCTYNVTFVTRDGFQFVLHNPNKRHFSVIKFNDLFGLNETLFYPGIRMLTSVQKLSSLQFVHSNELSKLKLRLYLKKQRIHEFFEICVKKVVVASVNIKWKFQTSIEARQLDDCFPNPTITGKDLSRLISLDLFNPVFIQLGNHYWYETKETDSFKTAKSYRKSIIEDFCNRPGLLMDKPIEDALALSKEPLDVTNFLNKVYKTTYKSNFRMPKINKWTKKEPGKHSLTIIKRNRMLKSLFAKRKKLNVRLSMKKSTNVVVEVCNSRHLVNVIWQDGTKELIPATDLYPVVGVMIPEFFPGKFVIENQKYSPTVYGVVENVDFTKRIACVQWFNDKTPGYLSPPALLKKSQHSVYDLNHHFEFYYDHHTLVVHMMLVGDDPSCLKFNMALLLRAEPDGRLSLMFSNGDMVQCWPQEIWNPKLSGGFILKDDNISNENLDNKSIRVAIDLIPSTSNPTAESKISSINPVSIIHIFSNKTLGKDGLTEILLPKDNSSVVPIEIIEDIHINSPGTSKHFLHKHYLKLHGIKYKSSTSDGKNICEMSMKVPGSDKQQIENDTIDESKKEEIAKKKDKGNEEYEVTDEDQKEDEDKVEKEGGDKDEKEGGDKDEKEDEEKKEEKEKEEENEEYNIAKSDIGVFEMLESCTMHRYISQKNVLCTRILNVINKEVKILQNSLPAGIWVKMYEERMDLLSVMIRGPENTPYAGGLYMFDIQLPAKYPHIPPQCHYYNFCYERLNPNLYIDGKVCLSLLGTWFGEESEKWSSKHSNLLQVLVSIQALIFVSEPYYNEPGLECLRTENMTEESSRVYNELVLMKVLQSMTSLLTKYSGPNALGCFVDEIKEHFKHHGPKMIETVEHWIKNSGKEVEEGDERDPGYPLLPLSTGFCISVSNSLKAFKKAVSKILSP